MSRSARPRRFRRPALFLRKASINGTLRISLLQKRSGNPFTEGSRELFDLAGQGRIDVFFLGGAQIDGEANINLVQAEGKRFPGSFGSAFMYFAARPHDPVPRGAFEARAGAEGGVHLRARLEPAGVERRGGPQALLTGKALFSWQKDRRRFRLESVHPGVSREEILDTTGFDFDGGPDAKVTPAPSAGDLALLRGAVATEIAANYPDFANRVWNKSLSS